MYIHTRVCERDICFIIMCMLHHSRLEPILLTKQHSTQLLSTLLTHSSWLVRRSDFRSNSLAMECVLPHLYMLMHTLCTCMLISTTVIQLVSRLNPNCFSLGGTIHGRCLVVSHLKFQRQEEKKASARSQENPWSTGFAEEKPRKKPWWPRKAGVQQMEPPLYVPSPFQNPRETYHLDGQRCIWKQLWNLWAVSPSWTWWSTSPFFAIRCLQ